MTWLAAWILLWGSKQMQHSMSARGSLVTWELDEVALVFSPEVQFLTPNTLLSQKGKPEHDLVFSPSSQAITVTRNWKIKIYCVIHFLLTPGNDALCQCSSEPCCTWSTNTQWLLRRKLFKALRTKIQDSYPEQRTQSLNCCREVGNTESLVLLINKKLKGKENKYRYRWSCHILRTIIPLQGHPIVRGFDTPVNILILPQGKGLRSNTGHLTYLHLNYLSDSSLSQICSHTGNSSTGKEHTGQHMWKGISLASNSKGTSPQIAVLVISI